MPLYLRGGITPHTAAAAALAGVGAVAAAEAFKPTVTGETTRRGDDWQCDHGAQYFTARDPDFRTEVARWQALGVAAVWQPRLEVFGGADLHTPDESLERFVGMPRMTAPARSLALMICIQPTGSGNGGFGFTRRPEGSGC